MTTKTNISSFDDPRGISGSTAQVTFGSPLSMDQIVFAALREPGVSKISRLNLKVDDNSDSADNLLLSSPLELPF